MDSNWTLMAQGQPEVLSQSDWLLEEVPEGGRVGFDPWLMPYISWEPLDRRIRLAKRSLVPVETNPIDVIWEDRPSRPNNSPLRILPLEFSGQSWPEKVEVVRTAMAVHKCQAVVLSALDEIAWLFNLRGSDIRHNPVFYAYAMITNNEVVLFVDPEKVAGTLDLLTHLTTESMKVSVEPYTTITARVLGLKATPAVERVWFDVFASFALFSLIPEEQRLVKQSPIAGLKAVKNASELAGMRQAHLQDAVALCDYLSWLEEVMTGPDTDKYTEYSAAQKVDSMRAEMEDYVSLSFDTISSVGPNGAIIHYKPNESDSLPLSRSQLYLVDSGGQYLTGTTDVTRTVHPGEPTPEEKTAFTLVLQGHVQLARAVFPSDVTGSRLDALARLPLWARGLEYKHGTGHGVGAFLNVHEGPCGFSGARSVANLEAGLKAGMVITIEPGYYKTDHFGIRIENVYAVVPAELQAIPNSCGTVANSSVETPPDKPFLTFEALTLTPIQTRLIDQSLLSTMEIAWINTYHTVCREVVGPELQRRGRTRAYSWLLRETEMIGK